MPQASERDRQRERDSATSAIDPVENLGRADGNADQEAAKRAAALDVSRDQPTPAPEDAGRSRESRQVIEQKEIGESIAAGMRKLQNPVATGVQYAANFEPEYKATLEISKKDPSKPSPGYPADEWAQAIAEARKRIEIWAIPPGLPLGGGFASTEYFENLGNIEWRLKPGKSASRAIQAWLFGTVTVAECNSTMVALEINALRLRLGDTRFDQLYGSESEPPQIKLLEVRRGFSGTPLEHLMRSTDGAEAKKMGMVGQIGHRPCRTGEWYYFKNHPSYLYRHPGGLFVGENATCLGYGDDHVQYWEGLGVPRCSEDAMLEELVEAYNTDQDEGELAALEAVKHKHHGRLPSEYANAPKQITKEQLLKSGGGLQLQNGLILDAKKVDELK